MPDTLLDSAYCPIPNPKPGDFAENRDAEKKRNESGIRNWTKSKLAELGHEVFGWGAEKAETKQSAKLRLDSLKLHILPPLVQKHMLAKQQIMEACVGEVELDQELVMVQDPRGNVYEVMLDFTTKFDTEKNPKQEIQQVRKLSTGTVLTFDSIGGKNGYNTEYRVTAKHGDRTEEWTLLAVRFGKMNNMFYHRRHELWNEQSKLEKLLETLRAEIREKTLRMLELQHEKATLQKALKTPPKLPAKHAKGKAAPKPVDTETQKKRIATIEGILPGLQADISEKTMAQVVAMEKLWKTSLALKNLPDQRGMKDSGAYIPYFNLRRKGESDKPNPLREMIALEVERAGIRSLKESVTRAWTAPDVARYATNLKDKSGEVLPFPNALPVQVGMVLAIVERMGFIEYASEYNPEKHVGKLKDAASIKAIMDSQIERALHNLGMNQEGAFDLVRSPAWARGISQMMPLTHRNFVSKYGSEPDDIMGRRRYDPRYIYASTNQAQSLRFMQVHLYDEARYLPVEIRDNWQKLISNPKTRSGLFGLLAAGYNGDIWRVKTEVGIPSGPGSMKDALKAPKSVPKRGAKAKKTFTKLMAPDADNGTDEIFGQLQKMLETDQLIKRLDGNIETSTYVMKFDYVWKYLEKKFPQEFGTAR